MLSWNSKMGKTTTFPQVILLYDRPIRAHDLHDWLHKPTEKLQGGPPVDDRNHWTWWCYFCHQKWRSNPICRSIYIYTIYIPKHSCHTNYSQVAKCTLLTPWYDACTEGWGGSQDFPATLQLPRENAQRTRNAGVKHAFSNVFHSLEGFFHVFPMFFQCFIHFQGTTGGSNGPQRLFIEESPSKKLSFWRKRTTRSEAAWLLDRVLDVYLHVLAQAVQY